MQQVLQTRYAARAQCGTLVVGDVGGFCWYLLGGDSHLYLPRFVLSVFAVAVSVAWRHLFPPHERSLANLIEEAEQRPLWRPRRCV
jgi:hypothetical protein